MISLFILYPYEKNKCGRSSAVEHHVANVRVVGSNPIARFLMTSSSYLDFVHLNEAISIRC